VKHYIVEPHWDRGRKDKVGWCWFYDFDTAWDYAVQTLGGEVFSVYDVTDLAKLEARVARIR